ncbi:helix-turn-helix domain-containing protein [Aureivirga marina]|uniref:helix-turn-helix domain-containing protein n=1 Tax=Aureivirga marina TaxID=1182451 RepID=UPI0018CA5369|nr:helix-turn-helix domain-containing protein [Aureivirga marina]
MQTLYWAGLGITLFNGFLLLSRGRKYIENFLLGAFFVLVSITFVDKLLMKENIEDRMTFLNLIVHSFVLPQFIFLYFYIDAYLFKVKFNTKRFKKHLYIFLVLVSFVTCIYFFAGEEIKPKLIFYTYVPTILAIILFYSSLLFLKIRDYYYTKNIDYTKFHWAIFLYLMMYVPFYITITYFVIKNFIEVDDTWIMIVDSSLIIIVSMGFHAMKFWNPDTFHHVKEISVTEYCNNSSSYFCAYNEAKKEVVELKETPKISSKKKIKYANSTLSKEEAIRIKEKLIAYIEKEQLYLDSSINMQQISKDLKISRHHLTEVLNTLIGKNFYTFINEYRVEEAKKRLIDSKYFNRTIISIGLDCGFNSKSSFNQVFKNITNFTPTEYRKEFI